MISKVKKNIQTYPFEIRILIIMAAGGLIFSVVTPIVSLFLDLGIMIIVASAGTSIVAFVVLYFAYFKRSYTLPIYVGMISLIVLFYPFMWISNAGSKGPMAFYMMFNAIFCAILLAYTNYKIILVLQIMVFYGLLVLEQIFPEMAIPYNDEITRSIDVGFSFTLVFLLMFFMIARIVREYKKAIKELEDTKLELQGMNNKLKVVSETDELTGICNRRHIMNRLNQMKVLDDIDNITLIMIDIDHFKKVNDTYGHSVGDEVIKKVTAILSHNIREEDLVGRIGGEEFLVLLPNTTFDEPYYIAERLRKKVEELQWEYKEMQVTISGGVYRKKDAETLDELLERVDQKLYIAKNSGRNCVCR